MKRTVMALAWQVFKVSTYTFSACLKAAWKATKESNTDNFNVWAKYGKVRIYFGDKFISVEGDERELILKDFSIEINKEKNRVHLETVKNYCSYIENVAELFKSKECKQQISNKIYKLMKELESYRNNKMFSRSNLIMIGRYLVYPLSYCVSANELEKFKNKVENY